MREYVVVLQRIEWQPCGYPTDFPYDFEAKVKADTVSEAIDKAKKFAETEYDWSMVSCDISAKLV